MIKVDNVSKKIKDQYLLKDVSIHISSGEKVAIIGPSGDGKTTLLNLLARILSFDAGTIEIDGKEIQSYSSNREYASKVGIVRQQYDLVGELKVIHNVLAGNLGSWSTLGSLISLVYPSKKQLAFDMLKKVGLENKLYQKTSLLSGGEQQRVALARMLLQDPEVILADEPVAALDPTRADMVLDLLCEHADKLGKTLVTVLHSTKHALSRFDRVIGIKKGTVLFDVTHDEISRELLKDLYEVT